MDFLYIISKTLPARNLCGGGLRGNRPRNDERLAEKAPSRAARRGKLWDALPESMAAKSVPCPRIGECADAAADGVAPFSAHRARFPESMAAKRISSPRIGECVAAAADEVVPFSAHRARFPEAKAAKSVPCPRIGECAAAADEVAPFSAHRARFPEAMAAKRISSPHIGECADAAVDGVAPFSAHRARFPESIAANRVLNIPPWECATTADEVAPASAHSFPYFLRRIQCAIGSTKSALSGQVASTLTNMPQNVSFSIDSAAIRRVSASTSPFTVSAARPRLSPA